MFRLSLCTIDQHQRRKNPEGRSCVETQGRMSVCAWDGVDGLWEAGGKGWDQVTKCFYRLYQGVWTLSGGLKSN